MGVSRFEVPSNGLVAAQVCLGQRVPAGDPVRLLAVARRSAAFAEELRRAAVVLLAGAEAGVWAGAAHRAFAQELQLRAPGLGAAADRYEAYAAALTGYAAVLEELGPRLTGARRLLQQRQAELTARPRLTADSGCLPSALPGGLAVSLPAAMAGAPDLAADLLPIAYRFKADYDRWADALDRCTGALLSAHHADPGRERHGLHALEHHLAAAAGGVLATFGELARHPTLEHLSASLGRLNAGLTVLGLGLLFLCPPVATACLVTATVLAGAQLAVDGTRHARGDQVSQASLGLELAAAIPVGGNALRGLRAAENVTHLVPGGGLVAHEGLQGGHTLTKHVGKTEEFLRNRLATEPGIKAASTFYDRQTAEGALSQFLDARAWEIARWLQGDGFELILRGRADRFIGFVIPRFATRPVEAAGLRLVLRRSSVTGVGFRVHTAMVTR